MSKLTLEQVQEELKTHSWQLVSTGYQNLDTELTLICPEGHKVYLSLKKWRRNHKCPICEMNPYTNMSSLQDLGTTKAFRVLALDQATETTGWAIFDNTSLKRFGIITFHDTNSAARMSALKQWLGSMVLSINPDMVIFEDIQLQTNAGSKDKEKNSGDEGRIVGVTTFKVLAQLQGVLTNFCYEKKIPYEFVHVSVWRKFCTIDGKYRADKKKSAQLKIKEWYDVTVPVDAAEAICIGKYAAEFKQRINKMVSWDI